MSTPEGHLRIRVRRGRAEDTEAVLAFTRSTWDGWDYLPDVWALWLDARDGAVFVAEAAATAGHPPGRPIAVGRIALLAPGESWMEGLRVDPAVRGRGVATSFQFAELTWVQAQGATVVRYATGETNEASLRLGARHGFSPAGRWRAIRPAEPDGSPAGGAARPTVLARLHALGVVVGEEGGTQDQWERLREDATFRGGEGLYEWRAWAWQALTKARLGRHRARGELLVIDAADGWALGLLAHERVAGETRLALLGGDAGPARRLVDAVTQVAGRRPIVRLPDPSPLLDGLGPALEGAGWRTGEHALALMARPLVDAAGRPLPLPDDDADRVEFVERPRRLGLVSRE